MTVRAQASSQPSATLSGKERVLSISAVIPTYNRRAHVLRAVESVFAQTSPVDEVIIVDDGSTDSSADAVRKHFGSAVTVLQQPNSGVSAARNRGVRAARGEWIAFLDSDDIWFPQKTERQMEALRQLGEDVGLCFTDNLFGGNPDMMFSRFEETGFMHAPKIGVLHDPIRYIVGGREPFFTSSLLIRRSLLTGMGGFDEALSIREDTDLVFRLSLLTQFGFVGEPFVQIDRTPSRELGLCNLYSIRNDRVFECSERLYSNWLTLPEVIGTDYERPIRSLLRFAHYDSAEAKIHELRFGPALREIRSLNGLGESYPSVVTTFVVRKIRKWLRNMNASKNRARNNENRPKFEAA
jgi:glycosyltransferase involved in cell wall biosynthesis